MFVINRKYFMFATAMATLHCGAAQAQPAAAATPEVAVQLNEVIVTARRKSETLQTVPVAVTALSGEFLDQQNTVDISSIPQFTPNLSVLQLPSSATAAAIYIRGVGNQEPSSVAEQGVGIYLDGVYVARSSGVLLDVVDLERIEVLRGPQGTLFGRNTVGGAVQLVSRKPGDDLGAELKVGYGSDNDWLIRGRLDTGYILGGKIKVSVTAQHHQRDGWVNNLLTPSDEDPGAMQADAVVVGIQGDFGPLTVNYSFDYSERTAWPEYFQLLVATPDVTNYFGQSAGLGGAPFVISPNRLDSGIQAGFVDREGKLRYDSRAEISGNALTLAYEPFDGLILKSITSYRRFFQDTIETLSGNGDLRGVVLDPLTFAPSIGAVTPFNGNNAPQRQWQVSQELQALGTVGNFSYVAGVYYFHEKATESNQQALTFVLPGGLAGFNLFPVQAFRGKTISEAAFGQVSWKPAAFEERLELTGGIRYTEDTKTLTLAGDVQPNLFGRVTFSNTSWLASVNYRVTPDVMVYARATTGYRSGGINPRASVINAFAPEKAKAYEAGLKSELLDRRLRLNISAFLTDYDDLQIPQFAAGAGGATSLIANAGKVQFRGYEVELTAVPVEGVSIDGSVGYTDPKFETYIYRDPVTNLLIDVADEARLPNSAKLNAHLGGQYAHPLDVGTLTVRADYSYRSEIYFSSLDRVNPFNREIRSRADENLKARISISDIAFHGGNLEVGAWGDNLTDQENINFAIDWGALGFGSGSFKRPRSFGFDVKLSF